MYQKIFDAKLIDHIPFDKKQGANFGFSDEYDYENSTMHSEFSVADGSVMMSDNVGGNPENQSNVEVLLVRDSQEQIENWYANAEIAGCEIIMKLQKQFWGAFYARFRDPFGIMWQMNFTPERS